MQLFPRAVLLICLIPRVALCQPVESLPPPPTNYAPTDLDRTGGQEPTANDFQLFLDNAAYDTSVARARPMNVSGLAAAVSGTTVTLTWTNPPAGFGAAATDRYIVLTSGATRVAPTATTHTFSPGAGQWTIALHSRRIAQGFTYAPLTPAPTVNVTVIGGGTSGQGWTAITLPAGGVALHVSAAGNDGSAGSSATPLKTLSAALSRANPGDHVYLKCGDTFAGPTINITKNGITFASYGTGARPKIRGANATVFSALGRDGLRFVGLDISPNRTTFEERKYGINANECKNTLIEDCFFSGADYAVVMESPNRANRNIGVTIRRNVFVDNGGNNAPSYRGGALYLASMTDWIIEDNVFDHNGFPLVGSGNIFTGRHSYIQKDGNSGDCDPGIYRNNIGIRGFDGDYQVRCGGTVTNNLSIACPLGGYVGDRPDGLKNDVSYNVAVESGDINTVDRRGRGLQVGGWSRVQNNVCAYNTGTGDGAAFGIDLMSGRGECWNNYIYEWTRTDGPGDTRDARSIMFEGSGGTYDVAGNRVFMSRNGIVMEAVGPVTGAGNQYWCPPGGVGDFGWGVNIFPGWGKSASLPADPSFRSLLPGGSIAAYTALVRGQSKANWRNDLMAQAVNKLIRDKVGVTNPPVP